MKNIIKNILLIFVGIVSIGLSVSCFISDTGDYVSEEFYGGDAYTGIQHAAAETGQNVRALTVIVSKGFGSVLLIYGMTLIAIGVSGAIQKKEKSDTQECVSTTSDTREPENS